MMCSIGRVTPVWVYNSGAICSEVVDPIFLGGNFAWTFI